MPVMSKVEQAFCRSAPWRWFAGRVVLPWALQGSSLTGTVLELGGGTGVMAEQTLRRNPGLALTMTDIDSKMVATAAERLRKWPNARAVVADVTQLPFDDHSFDAVTSYLMLHHVIAWEQAIREAVRVLRPGGTIIGYDLADTRIADWTHRLDGSPYRLLSPGELHDVLVRHGLRVTRFQRDLRGQVVTFAADKQSA